MKKWMNKKNDKLSKNKKSEENEWIKKKIYTNKWLSKINKW